MKNYEKYMEKCIELARQGEGQVSPNPLVGCVVLDKNGNEIATGYHKKCGEAHAEADALSKVDSEAIGGTLIVNLEPCNHYGKTPPCADLVIAKRIKTLVVGMRDQNPIADGGIEKCKKAGIEVIEGVLQDKALNLNEVFVKNIVKKATFVALKTATTIDCKIATKTGSSKWITSANSRGEVQKIRNRYDAILTTSSTVRKDNPSMTCRDGRNPIRIILDRDLKTDFNAKIYENTGDKVYIVVDENISDTRLLGIQTHIQIIKCPVNNLKFDLSYLFKKLFELKIMSVLIEAGGKLNGEAISLGLVDKIYHFVAPKILGDKEGINAFEGHSVLDINDSINFEIEEIKAFSPDYLVVYKPL